MTWLITCPACRLLLTPLHRLPHAITKQGSLPQFITIQRANASSPGVPTFERLCKVMCGSFYAPYINFHPLIHVTVFSGTKHQTLCSLWWWGTKIQGPTPSLVSPSLLLFVSLSWSSPSLSQLNHVHYRSPTIQSIDYTINHPSLSLLVIFLSPPPPPPPTGHLSLLCYLCRPEGVPFQLGPNQCVWRLLCSYRQTMSTSVLVHSTAFRSHPLTHTHMIYRQIANNTDTEIKSKWDIKREKETHIEMMQGRGRQELVGRAWGRWGGGRGEGGKSHISGKAVRGGGGGLQSQREVEKQRQKQRQKQGSRKTDEDRHVHVQAHTHTHKHTHTHSHTNSLSHTLTQAHTHTKLHTHTLTHTQNHTRTHAEEKRLSRSNSLRKAQWTSCHRQHRNAGSTEDTPQSPSSETTHSTINCLLHEQHQQTDIRHRNTTHSNINCLLHEQHQQTDICHPKHNTQ